MWCVRVIQYEVVLYIFITKRNLSEPNIVKRCVKMHDFYIVEVVPVLN
jgi:hypothetical protein